MIKRERILRASGDRLIVVSVYWTRHRLTQRTQGDVWLNSHLNATGR